MKPQSLFFSSSLYSLLGHLPNLHLISELYFVDITSKPFSVVSFPVGPKVPNQDGFPGYSVYSPLVYPGYQRPCIFYSESTLLSDDNQPDSNHQFLVNPYIQKSQSALFLDAYIWFDIKCKNRSLVIVARFNNNFFCSSSYIIVQCFVIYFKLQQTVDWIENA